MPVTADLRPVPAAPTAKAAQAAVPPCRECGIVDTIREVNTPGQGTGLGAVAGGVLGGLIGNQIGRGQGNTAATVVGAVGGAVAGNQIEKQTRAESHFEVTVRFADGSLRNFAQQGGTRWQVGDRVRLANGRLIAN